MASKALISILVTGMLVTGVCNTLLTKYQDMQCVRHCDGSKKRENFEQPVIQTVQMFIGESASWLVVLGFYIHKRFIAKETAPLLYRPIANGTDEVDSDDDDDDDVHHPLSSSGTLNPAAKPLYPNVDGCRQLKGWRLILLAIPASCDITGTTLMNVGLLFVAASIYQMTRGALILFVGLFSVIFLRRKIHLYQWTALFIVVIGVALVGLAGAIFKGDTNVPPSDGLGPSDELAKMVRDAASAATEPAVVNTVIGVLLIAFAQIFTATQFCVEEWILEQYALEPLKVVGWEGIFGFTITIIAQVILHFAVGRTSKGRNGYFDAEEGYKEVLTDRAIAVSSVLIMISIGGFNFFGLSVTRSISATSRSIIDTCRTLFIWIISLALGWESFKWLQVIGFAMLVYGTFLFNDLIRPPLKACLPDAGERQHEELLPEDPIEHI